ncbi:DNA-3-methyladenine glycosylase [Apilactobacillus quenuiae]|uniref:DNA-3-methyladenine glycosylase n=1 Tax=Apilactobacillus quenuiae TaxID=2008377 RepID=UPI001CDB4094|nr:DNA-3-methyladenine glycosylase [Apilactobacillus quenuiae]
MDIIKYLSNDSTENIAKKLLGNIITLKDNFGNVFSGYIVEDEAYLGISDKACHSYNGYHSIKNNSMYLKAGTIYIYTMFGYNLLNIITQSEGIPEGVLIRAVQPIKITDNMINNRAKDSYEITNGPGKLTQAFNIKMNLNGQMLNKCSLSLEIYNREIPKYINSSPRIGIKNKGIWTNKRLRFYVSNNPYVSKMKTSNFNLKTYGWKK